MFQYCLKTFWFTLRESITLFLIKIFKAIIRRGRFACSETMIDETDAFEPAGRY